MNFKHHCTADSRQARAETGLTTTWDASLGRILNQALHAYELQRATGVLAGNEACALVVCCVLLA